jgi:hypothetical protein
MPEKLFDKSWIKRLLFISAAKPLKKGNKKTFDIDDLYEIENYFLYSNNNPKLQKYYSQRHQKQSLFIILMGYLWKEIFLQTLNDLIANLIIVAIPYLFKYLITLLESSKIPGESKNKPSLLFI